MQRTVRVYSPSRDLSSDNTAAIAVKDRSRTNYRGAGHDDIEGRAQDARSPRQMLTHNATPVSAIQRLPFLRQARSRRGDRKQESREASKSSVHVNLPGNLK